MRKPSNNWCRRSDSTSYKVKSRLLEAVKVAGYICVEFLEIFIRAKKEAAD